jgi:hypothetical protein
MRTLTSVLKFVRTLVGFNFGVRDRAMHANPVANALRILEVNIATPVLEPEFITGCDQDTAALLANVVPLIDAVRVAVQRRQWRKVKQLKKQIKHTVPGVLAHIRSIVRSYVATIATVEQRRTSWLVNGGVAGDQCVISELTAHLGPWIQPCAALALNDLVNALIERNARDHGSTFGQLTWYQVKNETRALARKYTDRLTTCKDVITAVMEARYAVGYHVLTSLARYNIAADTFVPPIYSDLDIAVVSADGTPLEDDDMSSIYSSEGTGGDSGDDGEDDDEGATAVLDGPATLDAIDAANTAEELIRLIERVTGPQPPRFPGSRRSVFVPASKLDEARAAAWFGIRQIAEETGQTQVTPEIQAIFDDLGLPTMDLFSGIRAPAPAAPVLRESQRAAIASIQQVATAAGYGQEISSLVDAVTGPLAAGAEETKEDA